MTITTKDGIAVQLEIGQVITDPAECDLIGRTFSDGDTTGTVQRVELTNTDGILEPKLVFGQNYINIWQAYQVCEAYHGDMKWTIYKVNYFGQPTDYIEVYWCQTCEREGEQAQGNVVDTYELPI